MSLDDIDGVMERHLLGTTFRQMIRMCIPIVTANQHFINDSFPELGSVRDAAKEWMLLELQMNKSDASL